MNKVVTSAVIGLFAVCACVPVVALYGFHIPTHPTGYVHRGHGQVDGKPVERCSMWDGDMWSQVECTTAIPWWQKLAEKFVEVKP